MRKVAFSIAVALVSITLWNCSGGHKESNLDLIAKHQNTIAYDFDSFERLEDLEIATVLTKIQARDSQFLIPSRIQQMTKFPCSNCHTKSVEELKKLNNGVSAHLNIQLAHAHPVSMNCMTCHNMDKPDVLTSLTKTSISFDQSYQQCAQCHSTQFKDWEGGAHGKRLRGWLPPRISQTCVGCHNAHKPAFEKRWPSRLNTEKIKTQNH
ncbi:cytochrome c3 family protein [Ekhidna sp.]|uniref:cytochrome c3 family protein n=1 Tax=Ekhidna sp. TaxID=2608089 RepID=UPI00329804A1